jgi:hypothetical protein
MIVSKNVGRQAASMLCGKLLGTGVYRRVYLNEMNHDLVIKIEDGGGNFSNIKEWEVWQAMAEHQPVAKYLAACQYISGNGTILIQSRTYPIQPMHLPKNIPSFLNTDLKSENWGWSKTKKPVCHDYGNFRIGDGTKLVRADWSRG